MLMPCHDYLTLHSTIYCFCIQIFVFDIWQWYWRDHTSFRVRGKYASTDVFGMCSSQLVQALIDKKHLAKHFISVRLSPRPFYCSYVVRFSNGWTQAIWGSEFLDKARIVCKCMLLGQWKASRSDTHIMEHFPSYVEFLQCGMYLGKGVFVNFWSLHQVTEVQEWCKAVHNLWRHILHNCGDIYLSIFLGIGVDNIQEILPSLMPLNHLQSIVWSIVHVGNVKGQ